MVNLSGIIAIAGKPGLYKVLAQGKNNLVVTSLANGKKMAALATDRISALEDISIYTHDEDTLLKEVYFNIYNKENGGKAISHKEDISALKDYLLEVLPNYDEERVYPSDIKKLFQWYNMIQEAGMLELVEEEKGAEQIKNASSDEEE